MKAAFLANRPLASLKAPWAHSDAAFAAERLDGVTIDLGIFAHCTFANISFKGCAIVETRFINCTFISCYFRKTNIRGSQFDGCKFIDCDFPKVRIQVTRFLFPQFKGCFIAYDEMLPNLPVEPELRSQAAAELAREADALGHPRDARRYRRTSLRSYETHLWRACRASSSYYQEHYNVLDRIGAGGRWIASQANRLIWGNGENGLTLLVNFLMLIFVVFPLLFYSIGDVSDSSGKTTTLDYLLVSIGSATNDSGLSNVGLTSTSAQLIAAAEVVVGLVAFGLFITILFRRITRWR